MSTGLSSSKRAFEAYEAERRVEVLRLQNAARNSTEWFENVARYASLEPEQFVYSLLTRSQRLTHDNLRLRDRRYIDAIEAWLAERAGTLKPVPPMFAPFRLRELELPNRVVVSPMAMYSCVDGTPNDFYLVHLGARAQGGAGLVFTEMTCVADDARISPGCAGMYREEHCAAWTRIVDFVHGFTHAKIALQLGHAGPKGSTQRGWEEPDEPLPDGNWPLLAPSPLAYGVRNQTPRAMTLDDMARVTAQFVRAAEMGLRAGFDLLELHCAHGYLLSSFLTPLTNRRTDAYGGSLGEPAALSARGVRRGARRLARAQADVGADLGDRLGRRRQHAGRRGRERARVPRGGRRPDRRLRGTDLAPRAARLRAHVPDAVLRPHPQRAAHRDDGRRQHHRRGPGEQHRRSRTRRPASRSRARISRDPYFTLHAAARLGYDEQPWPEQYLPGREQYLRNLLRAAAIAAETASEVTR